jgi:DNA helicase II / ATP-dependent DNA helicase PcrA
VTTPLISTPGQLCDVMGMPFSDQQLAAIVAPLEPGVIVAGAGSGKTTVMAARVVWLVLRGEVAPGQVLGLTFTNKAAAELGGRVRQALAGAYSRVSPGVAADQDDEPTVATYHAFAGRLITEHGLRLGIEPDTRVMADATRFQLAASVIRAYRGDLSHLNTYLPNLVTDLLNLDGQMSEHLVTADDVRNIDAVARKSLADAKQVQDVVKAADATRRRDELLELVAAYRAAKRDRGVMDFSDQMALGATIAEQCPEVAAMERDRFRVVLLDEYQDTSVAQRRMLSGLFSGPPDGDGRGHPVTAVGDPCQAIYGWRGASVANLDEFPRHFPRRDATPARRHTLSVNRRCDVSILDAANRLADPLYAEHAGVEPLAARPEAQPGRIDVALLETHADEMSWVAARVRDVKNARPIRWSDIGILVHDNADARHLQVQLRRYGVPAEVVGLGGLLTRPEVADVVATLEVIHDLTANAAMLRLLTGPRWRIGPRDLALLGRRARNLADVGRDPAPDDLDGALADAVSGTDPTEIVSLADALEDPGALAYSAQARERFALLAEEIRRLRRHAGEPLVDLVRRVVDTIGLDVELTASASPVAAQGRDNLASFVDAVASYAGVDADASLPGLLAYLEAEDEFGTGLAVAAPTEADSVKLMTVHKAKGLEWDVVFLPALVRDVFPSARGRSRWTGSHKELPWPLRGDVDSLPDVADWSGKGLKEFAAAAREKDLLEERRLAYVALTRARHLLVASGHWWGRTQKRARGPSEYLDHLAGRVRAAGGEPMTWAEAPEDGVDNPMLEEVRSVPWPAELDVRELDSRRHAADLVRQAREDLAGPDATDDREAELPLDEQARVAEWDRELDRLLGEARAAQDSEREVELPASLSATAMMRLTADPEGLAQELVRPMPRRPSSAARFGTRFHAWVEAYVGQQQLLDPADIPGAADEGIDSDAELTELTEAFRAGPFGSRVPHQVEAPFALVLGGQVVRGRIDAVYVIDGGFEVVDWKTSQEQSADPLQLAIYRLAWAELTGTPLEDVRASFYYVRSAELVSPGDLPGRAELQAMLDKHT